MKRNKKPVVKIQPGENLITLIGKVISALESAGQTDFKIQSIVRNIIIADRRPETILADFVPHVTFQIEDPDSPQFSFQNMSKCQLATLIEQYSDQLNHILHHVCLFGDEIVKNNDICGFFALCYSLFINLGDLALSVSQKKSSSDERKYYGLYSKKAQSMGR